MSDWREQLIKNHPFMRHGYPSVGKGWRNVVETLVSNLSEVVEKNDLKSFAVVQIKEKFGELRVYYQGANNHIDEISSIVHEAERQSGITCEACGKPGKIVEINRWLKCACEEHGIKWPDDDWE